MKLGLDLSGGVHFKLEVDVAAATERQTGDQYETGIQKRGLREERIRGLNPSGWSESRHWYEFRDRGRSVKRRAA